MELMATWKNAGEGREGGNCDIGVPSRESSNTPSRFMSQKLKLIADSWRSLPIALEKTCKVWKIKPSKYFWLFIKLRPLKTEHRSECLCYHEHSFSSEIKATQTQIIKEKDFERCVSRVTNTPVKTLLAEYLCKSLLVPKCSQVACQSNDQSPLLFTWRSNTCCSSVTRAK